MIEGGARDLHLALSGRFQHLKRPLEKVRDERDAGVLDHEIDIPQTSVEIRRVAPRDRTEAG